MSNKSYKHWVIVFLMCCLSASSIGLCTNSIGVFYTPVSESLNVLRGSFALHATLSSISTAVVSLFMAKIMKKYNYKKLLITGILLASVSTILMAYSHSLYQFYILGIIRGIGIGIYGMVPLTVIISNWFMEKHGLATSIALSFSGLSGAIFSPILTSWIIKYGWRYTHLLMALCIVVLTLPVVLYHWSILPKDMNLHPYGYVDDQEKIASHKQAILNYLSIGFICMSIFTILHTSITGISQHLSGISVSIGLTATIGATMMSLTMIGNILTKLIIGILSDWFNPIKASVLMIIINLMSLYFLLTGMIHVNVNVLLLSSFFFGSIYSVGAVGIPLMTRYFFGNEKLW